MNGFRGAMHSIPTSTGMYPCPLVGQATSTEVNNDTRLRATSTPTVDHEPPSPMPSPIALNTTHDHEVDFQGATRLSFAGSISSIEESNGSSLVQSPIPVVQHNNSVLPWRPGCYLPYPLIEQKAELSSLEQNQRASSVIVTTNDSSTSHKDDDNASNATAMQGSQMEALLVMQSSAEERTARKAAEAERLEFTSPPPTYTYRWGDSNFQDSRDSTAMESSAEHENCAGTFSDTWSVYVDSEGHPIRMFKCMKADGESEDREEDELNKLTDGKANRLLRANNHVSAYSLALNVKRSSSFKQLFTSRVKKMILLPRLIPKLSNESRCRPFVPKYG